MPKLDQVLDGHVLATLAVDGHGVDREARQATVHRDHRDAEIQQAAEASGRAGGGRKDDPGDTFRCDDDGYYWILTCFLLPLRPMRLAIDVCDREEP